MDYQVIIFMARERLAAIDVCVDGKTDAISIDGNEVMEYSSGKEIKEFCQHIKNYYNMDAFSDLGMSISILRFDAVMEKVSILLEEIRGTAEYNLVSVEKLLPWMALKEGLLKAGTAIQMRTFDIVYTVSLDNDMIMKCQAGGEKEHSFLLSKEKFAEWDHLSGSIISFGDEEEKYKLRKKYDTEIKGLKNQLIVEKKKLRDAEENLTKIVSKIYEVRDKKRRGASKSICRLLCTDKAKEREFLASNSQNDSPHVDYLGGLWKEHKEYSFRVRDYCGDSEIVKAGQKVAIAEVLYLKNNESSSGSTASYTGILATAARYAALYNGKDLKEKTPKRRSSSEDFTIKAPTSGRLFWLNESGAELTYGVDIAVIGDVSDTKEEIISWYAEEIRKQYEKN